MQTYLKERIREVLTGSPTAIIVRIFGDDLPSLLAKAAEVEGGAQRHRRDRRPGHSEQLQEGIPQIQVEVDLAAAQRYGISPGGVRRTAAAL